MCSKVVKRGVRTFTPHYLYVSRPHTLQSLGQLRSQIVSSFVDVKRWFFNFAFTLSSVSCSLSMAIVSSMMEDEAVAAS